MEQLLTATDETTGRAVELPKGPSMNTEALTSIESQATWHNVAVGIIIGLIVGAIMALIPATMAKNRGRSFAAAWWVALLMPLGWPLLVFIFTLMPLRKERA
jgi:ABC-type amino acid transport system permease subunit